MNKSVVKGFTATNETKTATDEIKTATDETNSATDETKTAANETKTATDETNATDLNADELAVLAAIRKRPDLTQKQLHNETGIALGTIKRILPRLQEKGKLERVGNRRFGQWKVLD